MDRIPLRALATPSNTREHTPDVADLIVAYLRQLGVEYVFGVPGGAIEPVYNALARSARNGGPYPITARHEAGAAFMADGYARETGKIGVCIATSGPGATNMITGLACAFDNGVPMLAITGQPPLPSFGRRALQESACTGINVIGMLRHCTRYNSLISHTSQAETKVVSGIMRAYQMGGPSHLSIPLDVQRASLINPTPAYTLPNLIAKPALYDEFSVRQLEQELNAAQRPVFLIGGGCAGAAGLIVRLAERLGARFITTLDGKGFVNPHHPLYSGVFGFAGHLSARRLMESAPDLIIAVGTNLGEWASGGWSQTILNDHLIHIDASEDNLLRSPMARLHVRGHLMTVFEQLLACNFEARAVPSASPNFALLEDVAPEPQPAARVTPQALMRTLSRRCPPSTRFFADAGNSVAWAAHYLNLNDRRQRNRPLPGTDTALPSERRAVAHTWLRVTMEFAPMGWAIGAAVGAAFANPQHAVVCLTGDGSYLMNGQEITVAQQAGIPTIFIVLNDAALGMVMHGQRLAKAEPVGYHLPQIDFAAMARAMGIPAQVIATEADLDALDFDALFAQRGPTLLDVRIDPEQVPPIGVRMKALGTVK